MRVTGRQLLATALQAEIMPMSTLSPAVDEYGHRLVVRNGYHADREVVTEAGALPVRYSRR